MESRRLIERPRNTILIIYRGSEIYFIAFKGISDELVKFSAKISSNFYFFFFFKFLLKIFYLEILLIITRNNVTIFRQIVK